MVFAFKKMFISEEGVDNTSLLFYEQSILTPNFASCSSDLFLSLFFPQINRLLTGLRFVFVCEPTFLQQNFAYNVGHVSIYSIH